MMSEQDPSIHDLLNDPPTQGYAVVNDPDTKAKTKPRGKVYRRQLLPGHMLMNTRLIVGLTLITVAAIGLSVYALLRPARIEMVPYPTLIPFPTESYRIPEVMPVIITATAPGPRLYPTATAVFAPPYTDMEGQMVALNQELFGFPAGTRVRITATWLTNFDERWYSVVTENGTPMEVLESQLMFIIGSPTPAPPPSRFAHLQGTGVYWAVTVDPVAEIPINTKVRIEQAWFDGNQWLYTVAAEGSAVSFTAEEWELAYTPDSPPMQLT